jgi:hypothetical protein
MEVLMLVDQVDQVEVVQAVVQLKTIHQDLNRKVLDLTHHMDLQLDMVEVEAVEVIKPDFIHSVVNIMDKPVMVHQVEL